MNLIQVLEDEGELVDAAGMANVGAVSQAAQAQLGDELVDGNHDADSADETAEEGPREHAVEEAQTSHAGDEHHGTGHTGDDAAQAGVQVGIVIPTFAAVDAALDDGAHEEGSGRLGAHDHGRAAAEEGVDERVEDERVETVEGRDVGQVVGEREGHRDVHAGDGESGDEVALEVRPAVLARPDEDREVVGEVPGTPDRGDCQQAGHM